MSRTQDGPQPRTSVRRSYEQCLAARQQWKSIRAKTVNEAVRDEAHGDLHEAVMAWFEALVPYISERPGEVKQLWESAPLYPLEVKTQPVLQCPKCKSGWYEDDEDHDLGDGHPCPSCMAADLEAGEIQERNDDGEVLYEWACGLKRLASWSDKVETRTVQGSQWTSGTETVQVPKRISPEVLLRAARYLDLAAEKCGLLQSTDRALEVGDLEREAEDG